MIRMNSTCCIVIRQKHGEEAKTNMWYENISSSFLRKGKIAHGGRVATDDLDATGSDDPKKNGVRRS